MNKIIVPQGMKTKLQGLFNTSHVTVRRALNGETNSPLSQKIRRAALENKGIEMKPIEKEKNESS